MNTFPQTDQQYTGKGRVLRVKEGFNPNSSSLGSVVFSIHTAVVAAPVLLAGAAVWIASQMTRTDSSEKDSRSSEKKK